jgi:hypothetical protein
MFGYKDRVTIENLEGKTLINVEKYDDEKIIFETEDENVYRMYHRQDCCERVRVASIRGDLNKLANETVSHTSKSTFDNETPPSAPSYEPYDSFTWTIFEIETESGEKVSIWWIGESNGYYYEGVDIAKIS